MTCIFGRKKEFNILDVKNDKIKFALENARYMTILRNHVCTSFFKKFEIL